MRYYCPFIDQGYSIVQEAVVSLSLIVDGIFCSFLSDSKSFFTICFMSIQSNFSFICFVAILTCQMFIRQDILADIIEGIQRKGLSTRWSFI